MESVNNDTITTQDANAALVIVYNINRSAIDFHDDDEAMIDSNSSISTVSFGPSASRTMEFCDHARRPRNAQHAVECDSHDMMVMKLGCQKA